MILKDISFESPIDNILYDEVLLTLAEVHKSEDVLRFWESPCYFVVLGRIGKLNDDVRLSEVRQDQIPVLRRSSGGGTVLQGPGCLNYSYILSKEKTVEVGDLKKSYEYILGSVVDGLERAGVAAQYLPISDIALLNSNRKISGNAQKRGRNYVLHHGTLLYNFDLSLISHYLKHPKDRPEYRGDRSHQEFVANAGITAVDFKRSLVDQLGVTQGQGAIGREEERCLRDLRQKGKYYVDLDLEPDQNNVGKD